jgi:hypothetical protein
VELQIYSPVCFHGTDAVSLNYVVLVGSENKMDFSNVSSSLNVDFNKCAHSSLNTISVQS